MSCKERPRWVLILLRFAHYIHGQATISETKIMELKATVDKITADRDLAVKDREQAYESLSRTAISLQDYKVTFPLLVLSSYPHFIAPHDRCVLLSSSSL